MTTQIGTTRRKHLVFHLDGRRFALPLSNIREVIAKCDITSLPQVPDYYKGLINLRGQIISVVDLRTKLRLPERQDRETSIIISSWGDSTFGIVVDEVVEVKNYDMADLEEVKEASRDRKDGVVAIAKDSGEQLTLVLDLEVLMMTTEFKAILERAA